MNNSRHAARLVATDLDGTLFGPDGQVSTENRAALERLAAHGHRIVFASGRHAGDMARIAAEFPMIDAIVAGQGSEVCDPQRRRIHSRTFMQKTDVAAVVHAGLAEGFGVVAYTVDGEHTPREGPETARYRRIAKTAVACVAPEALIAEDVFKVMWIADAGRIDAFLAAGGRERCCPATATSVRSHREVFEYGPIGVSKATGVATIAEQFGIPSANVAVFGDAENDVPMFLWAGFSVAMPHAPADVRRRASAVAPDGPPESAFARGVELLGKALEASPSS